MTLVSRLSAFFLAALAVVLVGFSATLFVLATVHLDRQVNERRDAALAALAAAAEVGPEGVEWEPDERILIVGRDPGADQIRWLVRDEKGRVVDRSANLDARRLSPALPAGFVSGRLLGRDGRPWSVRVRRLTVPHSATKPSPSKPWPGRHSALELVAFAPLGPTEATLRGLGWTLAGLSAGVWLVAAVAGRRLCRSALSPLTRMAVAARDASAAEPDSRLPVPRTTDELAELGLAFNGLLDRLHEALERQRRFTGDASHQLRTPLTALLTQVDVALRRDRPPDEYRRVLGLVRGRAAHLRQIIESLLFLARAEADAECPDVERIDVGAWVDEHLRTWSVHPRAADLSLQRLEPTPLWAPVHPPLLAQVLDNLLENAFKYSDRGTPVVVSVRRTPGFVEIEVSDRGCGIAPKELPHVFTPFYRSPEARRRGQSGVGLGLAVADRIVTSFGGTIRAETRPEGGTRLIVRLPESAPGQPDEREPESAGRFSDPLVLVPTPRSDPEPHGDPTPN